MIQMRRFSVLHAHINAILDEAIEIIIYTADFLFNPLTRYAITQTFLHKKSPKSKKEKEKLYPNTMIHKVPTEKS